LLDNIHADLSDAELNQPQILVD